MTNKEFYKEQIFEIACSGNRIGTNEEGHLCECDCDLLCTYCSFFEAGTPCRDKFREWLDKEYICPFEKDELVEVSDDEKRWSLRHFSHIKNGIYYTYANGLTSKQTESTILWAYCRKYGTLGGLLNDNI